MKAPAVIKNYWIWTGIVLIFSCARQIGDAVETPHPRTSLFVREINRSDTAGFSGRVRLFWYGESPNGFIKGYEIRYDSQGCAVNSTKPWFFTTRTDSAFLFKLPPGSLTARIGFSVRAVDHLGKKDPDPPCLEVPVRNAIPSLSIVRNYSGGLALPDTVFSAFTIRFVMHDPDGFEDLDSVAIRINNSSWYLLPRRIQVITLLPMEPDRAGTSKAIVKVGNQAQIYFIASTDFSLQVSGYNKVYLKVKDASGTWSPVDSTNWFFIRRKTSDLLMLRSFIPGSNQDLNVYDTLLRNNYAGGYDLYDVNVNNKKHMPREWNLAFIEMLKLYDKVFVSAFTQRTPNEINAFMENASLALFNYINAGGKAWVSVSSLPNDPESPLYQFFPFDSISSSPGQARITSALLAQPNAKYSTQLLPLRTQSLLAGATPGYIKQGSEALFTIDYITNDGWVGPQNLAAASLGPNGKINLVVFSADLYRFSGNPAGLKALSNFILNNQFAP